MTSTRLFLVIPEILLRLLKVTLQTVASSKTFVGDISALNWLHQSLLELDLAGEKGLVENPPKPLCHFFNVQCLSHEAVSLTRRGSKIQRKSYRITLSSRKKGKEGSCKPKAMCIWTEKHNSVRPISASMEIIAQGVQLLCVKWRLVVNSSRVEEALELSNAARFAT